MTNERETNRQRSLNAFHVRKAEFNGLPAELQPASADHVGAEPETELWGRTAWLTDATAKLTDIADQHFHCDEYAR